MRFFKGKDPYYMSVVFLILTFVFLFCLFMSMTNNFQRDIQVDSNYRDYLRNTYFMPDSGIDYYVDSSSISTYDYIFWSLSLLSLMFSAEFIFYACGKFIKERDLSDNSL